MVYPTLPAGPIADALGLHAAIPYGRHACAQGKDTWTLLTNNLTASPMDRLIAEWLAERACFIGALIGSTDEQFNRETAAGQWTYRVVAKHVLTLEQDSLRTMAVDRDARASTSS